MTKPGQTPWKPRALCSGDFAIHAAMTSGFSSSALNSTQTSFIATQNEASLEQSALGPWSATPLTTTKYNPTIAACLNK